MDKVAIVILNYLNYKDTIECVESIKGQTYLNREIIVVDNGSNNKSFEVLNEKYKNNKQIHLIESKENLGFARGNNLGIKYASQELKANFVLVVNNDTIFKDNFLIEKLMESYETGVGVIGPRILAANGVEQNPVLKENVSRYQVYREYRVLTNKETWKDSIVCRALNKAKRVLLENKILNKPYNSMYLILHGACFMLTKDYFEYYPYLFPETFLYYEENILTILTKKVGLKKKFIDSCVIYHKEDQSSEMSFSNSSDVKKKFALESRVKCIEMYDMDYQEIVKKYFK